MTARKHIAQSSRQVQLSAPALTDSQLESDKLTFEPQWLSKKMLRGSEALIHTIYKHSTCEEVLALPVLVNSHLIVTWIIICCWIKGRNFMDPEIAWNAYSNVFYMVDIQYIHTEWIPNSPNPAWLHATVFIGHSRSDILSLFPSPPCFLKPLAFIRWNGLWPSGFLKELRFI